MSASARLLSSNTQVDRIRWPRPDAVGAGPQPIRKTGPATVHRGRPETAAHPPVVSPDAAERLTAVERDAFAKGYAQGERSGVDAAGKSNEGLLKRMVSTIDEIASLRAGMLRKTERELVRLAVAMAERIVRREVDVDAELLTSMARVAIDRLGESVAATIHLNPADHEVIMAARQGAPFGGSVQVVADPQVGRGGCLVRSAFGVVDAGIDTQIREMSHALLGEESAHEARPDGVTAGA